MKTAYQVYDKIKENGKVAPVMDNGVLQFKCYCSECGCPVYSARFPSERKECPHCHASFSPDEKISREMWLAELHHVGYTEQECGRWQ